RVLFRSDRLVEGGEEHAQHQADEDQQDVSSRQRGRRLPGGARCCSVGHSRSRSSVISEWKRSMSSTRRSASSGSHPERIEANSFRRSSSTASTSASPRGVAVARNALLSSGSASFCTTPWRSGAET